MQPFRRAVDCSWSRQHHVHDQATRAHIRERRRIGLTAAAPRPMGLVVVAAAAAAAAI